MAIPDYYKNKFVRNLGIKNSSEVLDEALHAYGWSTSQLDKVPGNFALTLIPVSKYELNPIPVTRMADIPAPGSLKIHPKPKTRQELWDNFQWRSQFLALNKSCLK